MDPCSQLVEFSSFLEDKSPGTEWNCPSCPICDHPKGAEKAASPRHVSQNGEDGRLSQQHLMAEAEASPAENSQARIDQQNLCKPAS